MTESETSVYVTDRDELLEQIVNGLFSLRNSSWSLRGRAPEVFEMAEVVMTFVDNLLEWGNGLDRQFSAMRATAGSLQKLLDESEGRLRASDSTARAFQRLHGVSALQRNLARTQAELAKLNKAILRKNRTIAALRSSVEEWKLAAEAEADEVDDLNSKQLQVAPTLGEAERVALADQLDHVADLLAFAPDEARDRLASIRNRLRGVQSEVDTEAGPRSWLVVNDTVRMNGTHEVGVVTYLYPDGDRTAQVSWPESGYRREQIADLRPSSSVQETERCEHNRLSRSCTECLTPEQMARLLDAIDGPTVEERLSLMLRGMARRVVQLRADMRTPAPRWDEDPIVQRLFPEALEGRCGKCGEKVPDGSGVRDTEETVGCACCFAAHPETWFKRGQCVSSESEPEGCGHSFKEHLINPARSSGDIEEKR